MITKSYYWLVFGLGCAPIIADSLEPALLASRLFEKPHVFRKVKHEGVSPRAVIDFVTKLLPSPSAVLEAGAFDGSDTVKLATAWPQAKIYAFEPVPQNFQRLLSSIQECPNVIPSKLALSDNCGNAEFHVAEHSLNPGVSVGSGSLIAPQEHLKYDKYVVFPKKITVETATLNRWAVENKVPVIDFMWLDLQGHELAMLGQASDLLPNVKIIYIEVAFVKAYKDQPLYADVKAWLKSKGFEMIARDFKEAHAAKGDAIPQNQRYFGNAIFANKKYFAGT